MNDFLPLSLNMNSCANSLIYAAFNSISNTIVNIPGFPMTIRFADKADCAAITEIYNHAVLHTAAIWNDRTVDTDNRLARMRPVNYWAIRCW